jgi:hypothetical protein
MLTLMLFSISFFDYFQYVKKHWTHSVRSSSEFQELNSIIKKHLWLINLLFSSLLFNQYSF